MSVSEENPVYLVTTDFVAPPNRLDEALDLYRRRVASIPLEWATVLFTDADAEPEDDPGYMYWSLLAESAYRSELGNPLEMEAFRVRTVVRISIEDVLDHPKIEKFFLEDVDGPTRFPAMVTPTRLQRMDNTGLAAEDISPLDRSFESMQESSTIEAGTWLAELVYLGADAEDIHVESLQRAAEMAGVTVQSVCEMKRVGDLVHPDIVGPLWVRAGNRNIRGLGDGHWPPGRPAFCDRAVLEVAEGYAVRIADAAVEPLEGDSQVVSRVIASKL